MKKVLMIGAVAAMLVLADSPWASARGGRRGGGCGGGGCGGGGCGGHMMGGCGGHGMGGCGMGGCGGYAMGGCGMGGHVWGGSYAGGSAYVLANPTEATIVVSLPADATLTIDGQATTSTSAQRVFVSPALEQGKEYEYTLKAEVVRNGKPKVMMTKVTVRAGQTSQVQLSVPAAGVAAQ